MKLIYSSSNPQDPTHHDPGKITLRADVTPLFDECTFIKKVIYKWFITGR
jgi:hypothetical protein